MTTLEKLYTAAELWELSRGEDHKRYELWNGRLIEVSPTGDMHTILSVWLAHLLLSFVVPRDLGDVTGEIGGYQLTEDTVLAPDVGFIAKGRLQQLTGKFIAFAPDLAIEIRSPGDTTTEIYEKVVEYFKYGTRLVWVVYPRSRTIHVYTSAVQVKILTVDDVLDGGDVLPGFSVPVREIFQRLGE